MFEVQCSLRFTLSLKFSLRVGPAFRLRLLGAMSCANSKSDGVVDGYYRVLLGRVCLFGGETKTLINWQAKVGVVGVGGEAI